MHVTSDYYRSREHLPEGKMGILERWNRSVQNASKGEQAEPLRPSRSTLRQLARHYEASHPLKHSA